MALPRNTLGPRNPLSWPAGRMAGINTRHPAIDKAPLLFSSVWSGTGHIDLTNWQAGTIYGTIFQLQPKIDNILGPVGEGTTTTGATGFYGSSALYSSSTIAILFYPLSASGVPAGLAATSGSSGGVGLLTHNSTLQWASGGTHNDLTGITLTAHAPYLVIASQLGTTSVTALVKNLATGQVQIGTYSGPTAATAGDGNILIGYSPGQSINSNAGIAAVAILGGALSTAEMQAWAADPWSFWYPPSAIEQMMLAGGPTLPIGAGSFNITTSWAAASPSHSAGTMNLTTSWSGVSPTAGYATGAGSMPLLSWSSGGVGAEINAQAGSMAWTFGGHMGNPPYSVVMSDTIKISDPLQYPFVGSLLVQNLTVHDASTVHWTWGRTLNQNLTIHDTEAEKVTYHVTDSEVIHLASALIRTFPAVLSQNLTVHMAETIALALTVLQRLKLIETLGPQTKFHLALVQAMLMNDALKRFFSAVLSQNLTVHPVMARTYVTSPVLSQNLTVHGALANSLVLQFHDTLDLTEHDIVNMIYKGDPLVDQINLTGLYVSPSGTATTWAINTRTNAVTEYTNYNFNSFAPFGLKYIAAASDGIYELDGENDDGESIIADIISGYMQLNNTKMAGLKGVYLAVRGVGQWYLKLIAGNGLEYLYKLQTQPGLMNTKVNIGKGLRTRYMAFQLTSIDGSDFDLDSLEFVPMLSDRRV